MDTCYKTIASFLLVISLALVPVFPGELRKHSQAQAEPPVLLTVTVTNKDGDFIRTLNQNNFEIAVDRKPARILSFKQEDEPVNIGILFDASSSIWLGTAKESRKRLATFQYALRQFFQLSNPANQYALLAFNNRPQLLVDWTANPERITAKVGDVSPRGGTALFDACYLAIDKVRNGPHSKSALILVSDGQDNRSQYTFKELQAFQRDTEVLIYSIYLDSSGSADAGSSLGLEGRHILSELSSGSGGALFFQSREDPLVDVLTNIANELRNQYTIGIATPRPPKERKWYKLSVKIKRSASEKEKLSGRLREGYFSH